MGRNFAKRRTDREVRQKRNFSSLLILYCFVCVLSMVRCMKGFIFYLILFCFVEVDQ